MNTSLDTELMQRALLLAQKPTIPPHPNPRVGCVIAAGRNILAEGYHISAGSEHAEVIALKSVTKLPADATMYVTLEPCSHFGQTPPCVDALIRAGLKRVVIGVQDPNPEVNGRGINRLRKAGIEVVSGVLADEAREMNKGFFMRHNRARPWVTVKIGASLDGRTALASGASQWITSEDSRCDVQLWRAESAAVMTGVGTVLRDDPRLNCRLKSVKVTPLRVVVDSNMRTPAGARLFTCSGKVIIATKADAVADSGLANRAEILRCATNESGKVDCRDLLERLAARQVNTVLVEAGSILVGSLLRDNLVDELVVYQAPSLLGDQATGMARLPELTSLSDKITLEFSEVKKLGADLRILAKVLRE